MRTEFTVANKTRILPTLSTLLYRTQIRAESCPDVLGPANWSSPGFRLPKTTLLQVINGT